MAVSGAYLDLIATEGKNSITHISLVNGSGTEVSSREAASWSGPSGGDGKIYLTSNIQFSITGGDTVAGWKGWSGSPGGTEYVHSTFATSETFGGDGTFTLLGGSTNTYIDHNAD